MQELNIRARLHPSQPELTIEDEFKDGADAATLLHHLNGHKGYTLYVRLREHLMRLYEERIASKNREKLLLGALSFYSEGLHLQGGIQEDGAVARAVLDQLQDRGLAPAEVSDGTL